MFDSPPPPPTHTEGADEEGYLPDDPVDPDQMSYEQLTALGEAVGTVARGLAPEAAAQLPRASYAQLRAAGAGAGVCGSSGGGGAGGAASGARQDGVPTEAGEDAGAGEEEQCPVCRLELEDNDELTVLPCGHYYHPDCVGEWLRRNKARGGQWR